MNSYNQAMYAPTPRSRKHSTSTAMSSVSSTTSSPPPSPRLKPRQRAPEKYLFTSIPLLFYVALSLLVLACCRQPTETTRPFVTTHHVYPLARNDSTVAPSSQYYWAARYLVPNHVAHSTTMRRWKVAVAMGMERIARVSSEFVAHRERLWDSRRARAWVAAAGESFRAAQAAVTSNMNNNSAWDPAAKVSSQASPLLPKSAQEVIFKTALVVGVVLIIVVLSEAL